MSYNNSKGKNYCFHFSSEEMEAEGVEVTFSKSHKKVRDLEKIKFPRRY